MASTSEAKVAEQYELLLAGLSSVPDERLKAALDALRELGELRELGVETRGYNLVGPYQSVDPGNR